MRYCKKCGDELITSYEAVSRITDTPSHESPYESNRGLSDHLKAFGLFCGYLGVFAGTVALMGEIFNGQPANFSALALLIGVVGFMIAYWHKI